MLIEIMVMTFNELYKKYAENVYSFAFKLTRNKHNAEDLTQNVFISVNNNFHTLKDESRVLSWLFRITMNMFINSTKKIRTYNELTEFNVGYTENDGLQNLYKSDITNLVAELPNGYRTVFNLVIDGYKHREIAEMLDINITTSKTQFLKARNRLAKQIN